MPCIEVERTGRGRGWSERAIFALQSLNREHPERKIVTRESADRVQALDQNFTIPLTLHEFEFAYWNQNPTAIRLLTSEKYFPEFGFPGPLLR